MNATKSVLKELGISTKSAAREYALLNASQKFAEFNQECEAFEKKHKMKFHDFDALLKSDKKEIFEKEDDYLAWRFAFEGRSYWQEKIAQT